LRAATAVFGGRFRRRPRAANVPTRSPDRSIDSRRVRSGSGLSALCGDRNPLASDPKLPSAPVFSEADSCTACHYVITLPRHSSDLCRYDPFFCLPFLQQRLRFSIRRSNPGENPWTMDL